MWSTFHSGIHTYISICICFTFCTKKIEYPFMKSRIRPENWSWFDVEKQVYVYFISLMSLKRKQPNLYEPGKLFCWKPAWCGCHFAAGQLRNTEELMLQLPAQKQGFPLNFPSWQKVTEQKEILCVRPNTFLRLTKFQTIRLVRVVHTKSQSKISRTKATKYLISLNYLPKEIKNIVCQRSNQALNV